VDARLLAPAGAAWACAALALLLCSTWPVALVVVVMVTLACVVTALLSHRALMLRAILLAAGFGMALGAVHAHARQSGPVEGWASSHAKVEVIARVTGDPIHRVSANAPVWLSQSSTSIAISAVHLARQRLEVDLSAPLELRLSPEQRAPEVGSLIAVRVRLAPAPWNRDVTAYAQQAGDIRVLRSPGLVDSAADALRSGLRESTAGLPPDIASLITGLAVGDISQQPPELSEAMRAAGLSHLTAVSGGNVAIVLASVLLVTSRLRLRRRARVIIALFALGFFVILVRPQPSVIRAAVMSGLVIVGMLTGGRRAGPAVLCASVLILIGLQPGLAVSWGFALSVAATAGLILVSPRLLRFLKQSRVTQRWPPALQEAVAIAASAQLATLPVLIAMGAGLSLLSIPANLLAMPAVAPITILGLLAAIMSPLAMPVAQLVAHLAAPFAWWIAHVAAWVNAMPFAHLGWPSGIPGIALLMSAVILAWWCRRLTRRRWPGGVPLQVSLTALALCCVLVAVLIIAPPGRRGWPPADWRMVMCDVGQGDALVLRNSNDSIVVIDVGPDPDLIDGCLGDLGVSSIDTVLLTHFHADHVVGLAGALRGRAVRQVLVTSIDEPPEQAEGARRTLAKYGMTATVARVDDVAGVGSIRWRVLWPRRRIDAGSVPNNASVVLHVTVDEVSILLTGDIEPEAQAAIIGAEPGLHVDVMKVPHHGSRYQDPRLPTWSGARLALISVGSGNSYGHPAPETIDAWVRVGARVARTDTEGDIAVVGGSMLGLVSRGG
jgi:competence protein ComEC